MNENLYAKDQGNFTDEYERIKAHTLQTYNIEKNYDYEHVIQALKYFID